MAHALAAHRPGAGIADLAEAVRGLPTPGRAQEAVPASCREMRYERGITGVHSRGEDGAWVERAGVCQDFALTVRGAAQPRGPGPLRVRLPRAQRDVTVGETSTGESHAWVEFWDNEWVACDPTNGTDVGSDHRRRPRPRLRGRPAVQGHLLGPRHASLEVSVAITRLA